MKKIDGENSGSDLMIKCILEGSNWPTTKCAHLGVVLCYKLMGYY